MLTVLPRSIGRLKSSSLPPCFHGNLPCDFCCNMPVCNSFSLLHFPSLFRGPYSSLSAIIFVPLPVLFLFFQSLISGFFSSYIILQIPFQILVQFKLTKTISPIPNNLCSQLFQACSLGSKCGIRSYAIKIISIAFVHSIPYTNPSAGSFLPSLLNFL